MERRKTVLITGASQGIGRATARLFGEKGYQVIIGYYKSKDAARALEQELLERGIRALALQADVREEAQVAALFSEAKERMGDIDVLVNNAGISEFSLFTDITEEQWENMFAVNCKGVFLCSKYALPYMISEKAGSIVNLSSMWGQVGGSCEVHYSSSKAAVIGMTKALAKEVGPSNVRVNCVAPGVIETHMIKEVAPDIKEELRRDTPLERLGTPEDVAGTICFLASPEADFITGQVLGINGGFVI